MSRWCSCGGSNENCCSCYGLGTVSDGRPTAPVTHARRTSPVEATKWKGATRLQPLTRRALRPLVPFPVFGCSAQLNPRRLETHLKKAHSNPPRVPLQFPAIPKIEEVKRESQREALHQLVPCAVSGCTAKLNPSKVERHLRKVHLRGIQSRLGGKPLNIRNAKVPIVSVARYIVSNSIPDGSPRVSSYGQSPDRNLDATNGLRARI